MKPTASQTQWHGIALVIVGAFCFSLAIPFTRWTHDLDTGTIVFWRALFGFLFLLAILPRFPQAVDANAYRASYKTLLLLGGAMAVVTFLVATTVMLQFAVEATAARVIEAGPALVVSRVDAGGWASIAADRAERIEKIPGVHAALPRVWGVLPGPPAVAVPSSIQDLICSWE